MLFSGGEFSPDLVRAALERGEDVNQRGPNNWSLLMFAAAENKIPLLRLMLEQPLIELNLASDNGTTALQNAVLRGHGEAVKLLLEHPSISVNLVSGAGFTALHMAACQGKSEAVKLLMADPRVDVNCKGPDGFTPLLLAAQNADNFDVLQLLLADQRFDVNYVASFSLPSGRKMVTTALMRATAGKNFKAVKLLLEDDRVDVNWMDGDGLNALDYSPMDTRILELFLSHPRVDLNCKTELGLTGQNVLHGAVIENNIEALRMILADTRFASHNALDKKGRSAAFIAAINGYWDLFKELVHHPKVDLAVSGLGPDDLIW